MYELFTAEECEVYFRAEVEAAGGPKKWLRKHRLTGFDSVEHMIASGRLFRDQRIRKVLGFEPVERWRATKPLASLTSEMRPEIPSNVGKK
jgi:hypothetical protein